MDAFIAIVNVAICIFAFIKGATYIRDGTNPRDNWWNANAAMVAIASIGIILNFHVLIKPSRAAPLGEFLPSVAPSAAPAGNLPSIEESLYRQSQLAAERANHLVKSAQLLKEINQA